MDEPARAQWEKTRTMGKWRFILSLGLVAWPVTMFGISRTVRYLRDRPLWDELGADVVTWIVGGILAAIIMWSVGERRYRDRARAPESH